MDGCFGLILMLVVTAISGIAKEWPVTTVVLILLYLGAAISETTEYEDARDRYKKKYGARHKKKRRRKMW